MINNNSNATCYSNDHHVSNQYVYVFKECDTTSNSQQNPYTLATCYSYHANFKKAALNNIRAYNRNGAFLLCMIMDRPPKQNCNEMKIYMTTTIIIHFMYTLNEQSIQCHTIDINNSYFELHRPAHTNIASCSVVYYLLEVRNNRFLPNNSCRSDEGRVDRKWIKANC